MNVELEEMKKSLSSASYSSFLGLRSKKGFLEEALTGMANTVWQSGNHFSRCAASPAENMTRVSARKSAAVAQAEPMAIPTSIVFNAQGTTWGREAQVGWPQCPQFKP